MPKKILIVDDEPSILMMVRKRFEAEQFEVLVSSDGEDALEKARTENPDVILLDLMLPKLNGYEVCTMLKQDTRYQKIPVVILTAKSQEKDEKLAFECGADAYVRKPFQAPELVKTVRGLMEGSPSAPEH